MDTKTTAGILGEDIFQVGCEVQFPIMPGEDIKQSRKITAINGDGSLHCTRTILSTGRVIDEPTASRPFWRALCERAGSKINRPT